ncbi:MAG: SDR family NAD(P)-dependent oxidoreductase [Planctomycetota bacterium]
MNDVTVRLPDLQSLENQNAVIVGGGTGIGSGIAAALAHAGAKVTIGGRRLEVLQATAAGITATIPVQAAAIDVGDDASVKTFFDSIASPVDILVNCAGVNIVDRTMAMMAPEDWEKVININATGAYRVMAAVLPSMRAHKSGLIINVSSIAGKRALDVAGVAYAASKFAMTALGTAVSNEVRMEGVRITNVYPGEANTPILDQRPVAVSQAHREQILQPEDVAAMVLTICQLPPRAHVPEMVMKPTTQHWM